MKHVKVISKNNKNWIVIIQSGVDVIQVHSNGLVSSGCDDREDIKEVKKDAENNELHTQTNKSGVRI